MREKSVESPVEDTGSDKGVDITNVETADLSMAHINLLAPHAAGTRELEGGCR